MQSIEISHFIKEDVMEKRSIVPELLSIKVTEECHQVSAVPLNRNVRMEMRELSNMSAKEFSFKTLQKHNKVTIQSDNDDEDDQSVNDDESVKGEVHFENHFYKIGLYSFVFTYKTFLRKQFVILAFSYFAIPCKNQSFCLKKTTPLKETHLIFITSIC